MIKQWRRWDPRIERNVPITEVRAFPRWIIEVVPDLFDPCNEALTERVLLQIARHGKNDKGRFLLRTSHVERALHALRRLRELGRNGHWNHPRIPNDCLVLAVYAETQEQIEMGAKVLFTPRTTPLDLIESDPNASIAMALREGVICDWRLDEANTALAKGAKSLREYLRGRMSDMHYCKGIPVPTIAIYVSPRERMDLGAILRPMKEAYDVFNAKSHGSPYYDDDNGKAVHQPRQFDWVVCAGRIGPFAKSFRGQGPRANDPHPMHHQWIADAFHAARDAGIPFCLPYLGEWAFTSELSWNGDALISSASWSATSRLDNDDIDWEHIDYDGALEHDEGYRSAHVQAIGSHLTGRAIGGRVFDEWPAFKA
jgi:hypothetical protein